MGAAGRPTTDTTLSVVAADFDLAGLLRVLQRDPQQRDALRRALLGEAGEDLAEAMARWAAAGARTDERLEALTGRMEELTAAQRRTDERMAELAGRIDELAAAQRRTEERVEELAAAQRRTEERLEGLIDQVSQLVTTTLALTSQVGALRGDAFERRYREFGYAYLRLVARRLRLLTGPDLDELLETAVEQGRIDDDASDQVRLADAVVRGRRRSDGEVGYVVLEASIGIGERDVQRAAERARLLAQTGTPADAVVAGERITAEAARLADELGVWQVTNGSARPPGLGGRPSLGLAE